MNSRENRKVSVRRDTPKGGGVDPVRYRDEAVLGGKQTSLLFVHEAVLLCVVARILAVEQDSQDVKVCRVSPTQSARSGTQSPGGKLDETRRAGRICNCSLCLRLRRKNRKEEADDTDI